MLVDVILRSFHHRDQDCIGIFFPYDQKIKALIKTIPGLAYSITHQCWYVPQRNGLVNEISNVLNGHAKLDTSELAGSVPSLSRVEDSATEEEQQLLRLMEQKLHLKGYAASTAKTYLEQFKLFLRFYRPASVVDLGEADIRSYLLYLIEKRKLSKSTQNQAINSIKFFFEKVLGEERKVYNIERPMKENMLPSVLSEEEIIEIFSVVTNLKHRLMLMIIYSAGLRRSELINLRKSDVNINRGTVLIKGGKGRKDRQSILAQSLTPSIIEYLEKYKPVYWMFEGLAKQKYSTTSLQVIFKRALKEAGISKDAHLHTLRHSFATHLLESGTSTRYIQELLGHESPLTTEVYTRVTRFSLDKIKSPLDKIVQQKRLRDGEE